MISYSFHNTSSFLHNIVFFKTHIKLCNIKSDGLAYSDSGFVSIKGYIMNNTVRMRVCIVLTRIWTRVVLDFLFHIVVKLGC